ncbi:hypothetical protein P152DRAFT_410805, partial [Eremomyces bilateralis CBS 781.70]
MLAQPSLKRHAFDFQDASPSKRTRRASDELPDIDEDIISPEHLISETECTPRTTRSSSTASRPKIYDCPYDACGKSFNRPCRLSDHIRTHTNERTHACPYPDCAKTFFRDTHMNRHIKSAHKQEHNYGCTWAGCGKRFNTGTRLRRHMKTHEDVQFQCTEYPPCGEMFRKHSTLAAHVSEVHLGRKPYPCPYTDDSTGEACPRGYDSAAKLKSHIEQNHESSKSYWCPTCTQHASSQLSDQLSDSPQQPPHLAPFPTYRALQTHIRDAHPPQCPHCSTPIHRAAALRAHIELHHPDAPERPDPADCKYACDMDGCGRAFTRQGILAEHKRLHHRKAGRKGDAEVYVAARKGKRSDTVMRLTG